MSWHSSINNYCFLDLKISVTTAINTSLSPNQGYAVTLTQTNKTFIQLYPRWCTPFCLRVDASPLTLVAGLKITLGKKIPNPQNMILQQEIFVDHQGQHHGIVVSYGHWRNYYFNFQRFDACLEASKISVYASTRSA